MFAFLPLFLRLPLVALLIALSTLAHTLPLFVVAFFKWLLPLPAFRRACNHVLVGLAESWIAVNSALFGLFTRTKFVIEGLEDLKTDGHYLVFANHQSWVDIPVLQKVFNRRIPFLRFFLKSQLIWVPLLGPAWWALDFPFMKRYSKEMLAKRPELAGQDTIATRRACEKFRDMPVSVMNFVEGTRFTPEKHARQLSPFAHLLKPKAGGVAFVLDAMGSALHSIVDVTLVYPGGKPTMFDLMANRVPEVRVQVRQRAIPAEFLAGDYESDRPFRARFQQWMNGVWRDKDEQITRMRVD
ncbi:MAG TPA: acyltransferase [Arenimonas sp.]|uniref:acyltransferase n=1 Tax=Arenimonas sp. TaxID=1872635 RepID=UPI002B552F27|nr:acyltransferase [Arenimonas sp.]HMB56531.1 acyltransferase [Arenimonas sp.]